MNDSDRRANTARAKAKAPEQFGSIRLGAVAAAAGQQQRDKQRQQQAAVPRDLPPILRKEAFES